MPNEIMLSRRDAVLGFCIAAAFPGTTSAVDRATSSRSAAWPVIGGDPRNTGWTPHSIAPDQQAEVDWSTDLTAFDGERPEEGHNNYPGPIVADNRVFVDGTALDPADGSGAWSADWTSVPAYHAGQLFAGDSDGIRALDVRSGDIRWEREDFRGPKRPVTVRDGVLYYGAGEDGIIARSADNGDIHWRTTAVDPDPSTETIFARGATAVAVSDDALAVGFQYKSDPDSRLYRSGGLAVLDVATGEPQWFRTGSPAPQLSTPAIDSNTLYAGSYDDGGVFAYDVSTGDRRWRYDTSGDVPGSPALVDNRVIAGIDSGETGTVVALRTEGGSVLWEADVGPVVTSPVVAGETVYVGTSTGELAALSVIDGAVRWVESFDTTFVPPSLAAGERRLFAVGTDGRMNAFVDVDNTPPEVIVDYEPATPTVGEPVRFNALESSDEHGIDRYEWAFGENESFEDLGPVVERTFESATDVQVQVRVTDDFGASTESTLTVTVGEPHELPEASFVYSPSDPTVDSPVSFDASSSVAHDGSIVAYEWEFGDGVTGEGETVDHTFDEPGEHAVTLRVRDDNGYEETEQRLIDVGRQRLNIALTGSSISTEVGETETATLSVTNFLTSEELTIQLLLETPSGIDISGVRGADEGSNQYTAVTTLSPADHENLRIDLVANDPGQYEITAIADYYFEDDPDDTGRHTETITFNASQSDDEPAASDAASGDGATDTGSADGLPSGQSDDEMGHGLVPGLVSVAGVLYALRSVSDSETDDR